MGRNRTRFGVPEFGRMRMTLQKFYRIVNLAGQLESAANHVGYKSPVRTKFGGQNFVVSDDFVRQFHGLKIKDFRHFLQAFFQAFLTAFLPQIFTDET